MTLRALGLCAGAVLIACVTSPGGATAVRPRPSTSPWGHIRHVVLMVQENRSFDEVLGAFCQQATRCDGYIGDVHLSDGSVVAMRPSPDVVGPDPSHTVKTQLTDIDGGKMDGWNRIPTCMNSGVNQCLTYYTPSQIPALTSFADKYVVSDHTFSMYDSPSWGGHIYAVAASQGGFTGDIPKPVPGVTPGPGWGCDAKLVAVWIDKNG